MTEKDSTLLIGLLRSGPEALLDTCTKYLEASYGKHRVFGTSDFVYATGDIPILLVAHLDTVLYKESKIMCTEDKSIWIGSDGLGADDRAGVFAILKLIQKKKQRPSVLFTMDEELGGLGAMTFAKLVPKPFVPTKYIIEIDRRGRGQCVFYDCDNKKFEKYVNSFGFTTHKGIFSDISFICPCWNIAGVNLSAGYYNEHMPQEHLKIDDLFYTIENVQKMLEDAENAPFFDYEYVKKGPVPFKRCGLCGTLIPESAAISVGKEQIVCCPHCTTDLVDWCEVCGKPFFGYESERRCEDCRNVENVRI